VLSYPQSRRTREIGMRITAGAGRSSVTRLLFAVALVSMLSPAYRATRVDSVEALRQE
jgi:ABC-type antimicrobial peptide transport system permease subunit